MSRKDKKNKKKDGKANKEAETSKTDTTPDEQEEGVSDGWVTIMILAILLSACLVSWWLAKKEGVPGAPGAPVGQVAPESHRRLEPRCISDRLMNGERLIRHATEYVV